MQSPCCIDSLTSIEIVIHTIEFDEMKPQIQIKLFANLGRFTPPEADSYAIEKGITIDALLEELNIPRDKAKLIFINGKKVDRKTSLQGGERVGIFPPIGGG